MSDRTDCRPAIATAVSALRDGSLSTSAAAFFAALGYGSDRTLSLQLAQDFIDRLDPGKRLTAPDRDKLHQAMALHLLFQITDDDLAVHDDMFKSRRELRRDEFNSYLFFAVDLPARAWTRTELSTLVRLINKPLAMPALVLFRHGDRASLGIIHRRLSRRDAARDVLEKVTLVKDIDLVSPIRAHLEILNDFALANLEADYGVSTFVGLHEAWQKRLSAFALSNDFYREIADWYFWAQHEVEDGNIELPRDCDTEQEKSLFLIRLLTRIIFCWFLVEKRLVPPELFQSHRLTELLKDFSPSADPRKPDRAPTFYHAVLQNLFFGTLNMPREQRAFRERKVVGERYDSNYGVTNLWRHQSNFHNSADWEAFASRIPFMNGGLFDCLDEKLGRGHQSIILDGFSDNPKLACRLPNDLFFGPERTVDLSKDYGEENKKAARSKRARVRGLIDIMARYKFTIEENTPLEEEIALDPELLGKVFENLLASYNEDTKTTARKALGAFYTPREIVSYMVDEALKAYLAGKVPRCKGVLEDLFSNKATFRDVTEETRAALVRAIGQVKIVDPACGSGAFPMGALHRLVDLLNKLDPNNESWKRDRLAVARQSFEWLKRAGAPSEKIQEAQTRIADIEKSFDTRFHALGYARKLYLIENAIYGVDIQPVAVQIAKLRFFIALVVDQNVDQHADNFGVRPLPNLETRLVSADTLVPIEKDESNLFSRDVERLRDELAEIRHEHFNARSPAAKKKWRTADQLKRAEIARHLEQNHMLSKNSARALAAWDPYDQNRSAPFFDSEWMFGLPTGKTKREGRALVTLLDNLSLINEAGGQGELTPSTTREIDSGFDIVIGNPPYLRIQTLKRTNPRLVSFFKSNYATASQGNYDLYVVFIEAGLSLLKANGQLAFICPHKFFNAQYGKPLRQIISKGRYLRHVVHFGEQQVFPGASIYTCLLFLKKDGASDCRVVRAHDLEAWRRSFTGDEGIFPATSIGQDEWIFPVGRERAVFERLRSTVRTLESVSSRIFQGIKTSADKIYIVDQRQRNRSMLTVYSPQTEREHEVEPNLFHPLVKGGDSRTFLLTKTDRLILFPYARGVDGDMSLIPITTLKTKYPHTWAYLEANRKFLRDRENGKMRHENWYGYVYPKALDVMSLPKIFTPDLAPAASFSFDESGELFFTGGVAGGYGILPKQDIHPKWLLAILNSRAVDFFHHQVSSQMRGGWYSYEARFIKDLPIAESPKEFVELIVGLVDVILFTRQHATALSIVPGARDQLMLAYWERMLNGLIYELYFSDELHRADLRLFDLATRCGLIDFALNLKRPQHLRQYFETVYGGSHPLRIALDKLQTLDTVRIIEAKA